RDLFDGIFLRLRNLANSREVDFEITTTADDGGPGSLILYDQDRTPITNRGSFNAGMRKETTLTVAGRPLTIHVYALENFIHANDSFVPSTILAIGIALSVLLARIFWVYTKQTEIAMKSERQLRLVTDALPVLISYIDPQ